MKIFLFFTVISVLLSLVFFPASLDYDIMYNNINNMKRCRGSWGGQCGRRCEHRRVVMRCPYCQRIGCMGRCRLHTPSMHVVRRAIITKMPPMHNLMTEIKKVMEKVKAKNLARSKYAPVPAIKMPALPAIKMPAPPAMPKMPTAASAPIVLPAIPKMPTVTPAPIAMPKMPTAPPSIVLPSIPKMPTAPPAIALPVMPKMPIATPAATPAMQKMPIVTPPAAPQPPAQPPAMQKMPTPAPTPAPAKPPVKKESFENFSNENMMSFSYEKSSEYQSIPLLAQMDENKNPKNLFFGKADRFIMMKNKQLNYRLEIYSNLLVLDGDIYNKQKVNQMYKVILIDTKKNQTLYLGDLKRDGDGIYKIKYDSVDNKKSVEDLLRYNKVQIIYSVDKKDEIMLEGMFR